MNDDATMTKQKVYETGRVSTVNEIEAFFVLIRELFPEINSFINTHELINGEIFNNECFSIVFGRRKTVLYLNNNAVRA